MNNKHTRRGFTLIELLVVVLIIGILAAVALPQYQKTVERSRAVEGLTLIKSVHHAFQQYYLENGTYPTNFDELDIQIPWKRTTPLFFKQATDALSDGTWSLEIENTQYTILYMALITGKYKGAGFLVFYKSPDWKDVLGKIYCMERKLGTRVTFSTALGDGAYCEKILHSSFDDEDTYTRTYLLN